MAISEFFIRYLQRRDTLSPSDLVRLRAIKTTQVNFQPAAVIVPQREVLHRSCMMLQGMSAHAHRLSGRPDVQVITALNIPGDFVDLHGWMLKQLDHDVISMGPSRVEFVDHEELMDISRHYPHLARLLWMSTMINGAIHRQWLVAAASLRSTAHLAHLICEVYTRQASIGAVHDYRFSLPILQRELADILGYSPIHINRAVRDLKDRGLLRWVGPEIQILDWDELCRLARFDPEYLQLERRAL